MIEQASDETLPFGLDQRAVDALEVLERTGSNLAVCKELVIGEVALARIFSRACATAGVENRIQLLVKWVRWQCEGRAA